MVEELELKGGLMHQSLTITDNYLQSNPGRLLVKGNLIEALTEENREREREEEVNPVVKTLTLPSKK
jgi:hypothetical protein